MGRYPLIIGEEFLAEIGLQVKKNSKLYRMLKKLAP
jgi:hypothetical protein